MSRTRSSLGVIAVVAGGFVVLAVMPARLEPSGTFAPPRVTHPWPVDPSHADEMRELALQRAKVWLPTDPSQVDLGANPPDPTGALSGPTVRCRFLPRAARGTTTKFDCVLPDGEIVKVKYGVTGEIQAEVAASRLLSALGFGADRMFLLPKVRCFGCPRVPFYTMWALDVLHARELVTRVLPADGYTDFTWAAVERRFPGLEVEARGKEGWAWFELDRIDHAQGASLAEVDALRLVAVLIAHWDNKAPNQRLVCTRVEPDETGACTASFALIQDLGATFGPNKVDLVGWKSSPIWTDAARCLVSLRAFPYAGGTFPDRTISEAGRELLARQLAGLSEAQVAALFTAARFPEFYGGSGDAADVHQWAKVFFDKVRQISEREPCPGE